MKASHDAAEIILPSEYDIICGQGDKSQEIKEKIRFHDAIYMHKEMYQKSETKREKTQITLKIVCNIKSCSPVGRFVTKKGGKWIELEDSSAREKFSQAL